MSKILSIEKIWPVNLLALDCFSQINAAYEQPGWYTASIKFHPLCSFQ